MCFKEHYIKVSSSVYAFSIKIAQNVKTNKFIVFRCKDNISPKRDLIKHSRVKHHLAQLSNPLVGHNMGESSHYSDLENTTGFGKTKCKGTPYIETWTPVIKYLFT